MSNNYVTALAPNCASFTWDWKDAKPVALIEQAVQEAGGTFAAYTIDSGYDHGMVVIAPSKEWADQFQLEWNRAMGTDETPNPEYILSEQVERETIVVHQKEIDLPF